MNRKGLRPWPKEHTLDPSEHDPKHAAEEAPSFREDVVCTDEALRELEDEVG